MAGMLDVIAGMPKPEDTSQLDAGTQRLIDTQKARANRDVSAFAADQMAGTSDASSQMYTPERMQRENSALAMADDPTIRRALADRQQRYFNTNEANLQTHANAMAPIQKFNAMDLTSQYELQKVQAFNRNVQRQNQYNVDATNARNSVISSLFGGMSSMGGAMAARGRSKKGPRGVSVEEGPGGHTEYEDK